MDTKKQLNPDVVSNVFTLQAGDTVALLYTLLWCIKEYIPSAVECWVTQSNIYKHNLYKVYKISEHQKYDVCSVSSATLRFGEFPSVIEKMQY